MTFMLKRRFKMDKQSKLLAIVSVILGIIAVISIFGWAYSAAENSANQGQLNQTKTDLSVAKQDLKECKADLLNATSCDCPEPTASTTLVDLSAVKEKALQDFLEEYEDDEEFTCGSSEYDFDQISVVSVSKDWEYNQIDEDEYSVSLIAKLKFSDKDVEEKCYQKFNISVDYEEDEDPDVDYELA